MRPKHKHKEDNAVAKRIAVYLSGFLGGLLVYTVLKVCLVTCTGRITSTKSWSLLPSQMTVLPEMQPDDMSFYQDNDKLGAGMLFLYVRCTSAAHHHGTLWNVLQRAS